MTRTRWIIAGAVALGLLGGGAGIALATGTQHEDDGTERPITGDALNKAKAAALEHTGGGRVTETEAGDEEGYYEVEVTRDDGSQVDVHLDRSFHVIDSSADGRGDDDSGENEG